MVTAQDAFDYMAKVFKKEEAKAYKKTIVITYNVAGPGGGTWQATIENGEFKVQPGETISPVTATVNYIDAECFYKLVTGEMNGIKGYATGKIKFKGSPSVLQTVGKLFPGKKKAGLT